MKKTSLLLFVILLAPPLCTQNLASKSLDMESGNETIRYYYKRLITDDDLNDKSLRELSIMRNAIYAKAGYVFHTEWLAEHFSRQPWYQPGEYDNSKLSAIDQKNASIIAKREAGMPREKLLASRQKLHELKLAGKWNSDMDLELGLISTALGESAKWDPSSKNRSPLENPALLDKLFSVKEVEHLSRRDLRILRNMIFARHGRPFKSEILQEYFGRMAWYKIDPDYTSERLSKIDQKNIRILLSVEESHGGPLTEAAHAEEEGSEQHWFSHA